MHRREFILPPLGLFSASSAIQGSRLLLNLRRLSDPERVELEMSSMTTGVRFAGKPRPSVIMNNSQSHGTTYTVDPTTEDEITELEHGDKPRGIQKV